MRVPEGVQRFGLNESELSVAAASPPSSQCDDTPNPRRGENSVGTRPEALTESCRIPPHIATEHTCVRSMTRSLAAPVGGPDVHVFEADAASHGAALAAGT